MASKIGPRAVIVTNESGEPVTLLPGDDVPEWAEVGDHALEGADAPEPDGGEPLDDKGTKIDGGEPEEGVPADGDTPDADLAGTDQGTDEAPDFTKPAVRKAKK